MIAIHTSLLVRRRAIMVAAMAAVVILAALLVMRTAYASDASSEQQTDQHILNVHDGETQRGFLTEADTLGEALTRAGIAINANDRTEPALDEPLVASTYDVNIYRARPVLVIDGEKRTKVITPYHTSKQIAEHASIELNDQDVATLSGSSDFMSDGALEVMTIDRATKFTLVFYGKKMTAYTRATTVGDMLKERDISLKKDDTLSVSQSTKIRDGMTIELWRNGTQTVTKEESVAFSERTIEDANQKVGYRKVKTPGVKGQKTVTYEITMKNGKEVGRKEIKSVVTKKPSEQVVIVGTKPNFGGDFGAALAKLRSCEGGYESWNPAGPYYGAYQFDRSTWNSVSSAPYGSASPAEQDAAARALYERRGWQPWPVCGAGLPDIYR